MKILVLMPENAVRQQFLTPANTLLLEEVGDVVWNQTGRQYTTQELQTLLPEMDALITGWGCPRIGIDVLGKGKYPGILAHTGGTIAPYVDAGTYQAGIHVVSANELYAKSVAEGTLAYMLSALRRIPYWDHMVKSGSWRGAEFENYGLFGKRVGLTGFGATVRHLLPLLKVFDTEILVCSGHLSSEECQVYGVKPAGLEEIFSTCDVISLHNALTDTTRHMINGNLLGMIQDGAVLINTARGAVIDQQALISALSERRFTALLDVFETEPLELDSPLRSMDNVILVPHMAGPTSDLYERVGRTMIEEIKNFKENKTLRYEIPASAMNFMTAKG